MDYGLSGYGSDKDGLVCGYLFAPDTAGRPIEAEAAAAWLEAKADGSFLWLHFNASNAGAERCMGQKLALPDAFRESLHAELGSTPVEQSGELAARQPERRAVRLRVRT